MAKKGKQDFIDWCLEQGVGGIYTIILSLTIGITKWLIIGILFFIAWWEKIR